MDYQSKYKDCLEYIDSYWSKVIHKPARQKINHNFITIPYNFITPNDKKFSYIFYWDTFFMFRGLMGTKREWIMKDMVENLAHLYNRYHIIPNFNSHASIGRSQPPFLTSMILDVYKTFNNGNHSLKGVSLIKNLLLSPRATFGNMNWIKEKIALAKKEYDHVWNNDDLYNHYIKKFSLNRYGDRDIGYAHSSELESGWDFTSRFYNRCNEFLPIDLNCFLYKYEEDFELASSLLGETDEMQYWENQAEKRKNIINKLMWNEEEGFFFDFDYVNKKQSKFLSLAGFIPLWAGIVSKNQAEEIVKKLPDFETKYGLTISSRESLVPKINLSKIPVNFRPAIKEIIKPKQWDYPNIWPPLEYLTVIGLLKYGFIEEAKRIMQKSVEAHAGIFKRYKTFFERIDGVNGDKPINSHYPIQSGFGWTNAIFFRYIHILQHIEDGKDIYTFPKEDLPPYDLSVLN